MKKMYVTMLAALVCTSMWAAGGSKITGTCNGKIGANENQYACITWSTDADGAVVISISGWAGDLGTSFRGGNGMASSGFLYKGETMTNYFDRQYGGDRSTFIRWVPKEGVTPQAGDVITFNANSTQQLEWYTSKASPNDNQYNFTYEYGSNCSQLAVPSNVSVTAAGVITFTGDANAEGYMVKVMRGETVVHRQMMSASGETIDYSSYMDVDLSVTVQALGWASEYVSSAESAPFTWHPAVATLGLSEVCAEQIGNNANNYCHITWETDAEGQVVITISDAAGKTGTTFRGGNGMGVSGFKYNGEPITNYFNKVYGGDRTTTYVLTPKDKSTVFYGDQITFNKFGEQQQIEWYVGTTGANGNQYSFSYTYGTSCAKLVAPANVAVSADSVLTFDAVTGADSYFARVSYNGQVVYSATVQSGDKLHVTPYREGTYNVTVTAKADGMVDSPESDPYAWNLKAVKIVLGMSEYCEYAIGSGNTLAFLTWETDANGDVVITLTGGADEREGYSLRSQAMDNQNLENFKISGQFVKTYFERNYTNNTNQPFILHLKDPSNAPVPGEQIIYTGTVEWKTPDNTNAYQTYTFTYTYGTKCTAPLAALSTPAISSITAPGVIVFDAVENAASYKVRIFDADDDQVSEQSIVSGGTIERGSAIEAGFDYTVRLQALPEAGSTEYAESEWSAPFPWTPEDKSTALPMTLSDQEGAYKVLLQGVLYIIRNGVMYNATGMQATR